MTVEEVMQMLEARKNEGTRKVLLNHGAPDTILGVKIGDLQPIRKQIKVDHDLALKLYDTGISDAMYLAGLIADEKAVTEAQLEDWVQKASWHMISEYTVPWLAAESKHGFSLARKWVENPNPSVAAAGWTTFSNLLALTADEKLDMQELRDLLAIVENEVHSAPNRVRYAMNGFVIALGVYVPALTDLAKETGKRIGKVKVNMGNTDCIVPYSPEQIEKAAKRGPLGKKKKMVRC